MAISSSESAGTPLPSDSARASGRNEAKEASTTESPSDKRVVLEVKNLKTYFFTYDGVVTALDGVSFKIRAGETTGLVGETGCGKSVTAFSITRLIADPPGRVMSGQVLFDRADLLWDLPNEAWFSSSSHRRLKQLLAEDEQAATVLTNKFVTDAAAQGSAAEIQASVTRLKEIVGTDPEVLQLLARIQTATERLATAAGGDTAVQGALSTLQANLVPLQKIYRTHRVRVKRSFRRIKAATERLAAVRGKSIATIFQEPTQAMNPIFSIADQLGETLLLHRGIEIIDELLAATPKTPEVSAAIEELVTACRDGTLDQVRARALGVGDAAHVRSFGTQAFYIARAAGSDVESIRSDIERAQRRLRLSGFQRRYLAYQRRLIEIQARLGQVHLQEMRDRHSLGGERRSLGRYRSGLRSTHFYFGIRGIRSRAHRPLKDELFWRSVGLLEGVSIANPVQVSRGYPHELSGGMLQRVMIAMALSTEPKILLADEPTTALDVTIQAQILELMRELKHRVGTAILLITHDLAVVAEVADRVCVMYAGVIVEQGSVREVFQHPLHPYAQGLLASIPRIDQPNKELSSIPGSVPDLIHPPTGCRFHPRCPYAMPICKEYRPPMTLEGTEHRVACYLYKGPVASE
jgi:peptide/nickel transport system ATP-binding protein